MIYSEDFREKALEMVEKIGVRKASKELHVREQTLYSWKKKANKTDAISPVSKEETDTNYNTIGIKLDLKEELENQRRVNQSCQQTIEYLVEENTSLRQQCENYLMAIRLISQR